MPRVGEAQPHRVQLRRTKGWKMPPNTVKVDRSTAWGNPFIVERETAQTWLPTRGNWFRFWRMRGLSNPHYQPDLGFPDYRTGLLRDDATRCAIRRFCEVVAPRLDVTPLRGKNLACWCALDAPCHAAVLLELANAPDGALRSDAELGPGNTPDQDQRP